MAALLPRPLSAPPAVDAASRLVRPPNCPWPGCSGAPSAVARSPPAQPHRALRPEQVVSSRWVTWGRRCRPDSGCSVQEDRLGCRKAMRPSNTGPRCVGRYPELHTARLLGALDKDAARRQPAPIGPEMAPAASVTRWESRCRGFHPLARRLASRRESGRLPAERLAAAVDLEAPSSTARVGARPSARWSGPQRQQPQRPFQGLTGSPLGSFGKAGAQRTLEQVCGRVGAKV